MQELHLTAKDFKLEWYSGSGKGGQHRNKHQNCCRITHLESDLSSVGTESKSRINNQKTAFNNLAKKILKLYSIQKERFTIPNTLVRNYHSVRNEVHDKASGLKVPYDYVLFGSGCEEVINARRKSLMEIN